MLDVSYLRSLIENNDPEKIANYLKQNNLKLDGSKIVADKEVLEEAIGYWDKRQLVRKILLNSAYGSLLNNYCRFYDKRIGQSVTLSGRQIVKHMGSYVNELITGEYDYIGDSVVAGDTDSVYFSAWPIIKDQVESGEMEWTKETAVKLYDAIADQVNESFPTFMEQAFHCPRNQGAIIKCGREIVGDAGLFIKKKRYAINVYDKEGKRLDKDGKTGSIKAMGLEVKRSDTPKYIQKFLMELLELTLSGKSKEEVIEHIRQFKYILSDQEPWTKGSPKAVNKLTYYGNLDKHSKKKPNIPGHVRAALNWNYLRKAYSDNYSMEIMDGMKVVVCKLKQNPLGFTSVAYPVDEKRLPQWFKDLPFDNAAMENVLVDKKTENLLGVLNWNIKIESDTKTTFNDIFVFE